MEKQANQETKQRKSDHVRIALEKNVESMGTRTGFEKFRFHHQALPELDFDEISLKTQFLGRSMRTPLLISSMTGGTEEVARINQWLAMAAQERGWAMGLGSMRVALENPEIVHTFQVRRYAPDIPILANLGAVQLNKGVSIDDCRALVEMVDADALILHLNSLQEVFQPEGDTNFKGLLQKIEQVVIHLKVPVGVKEVGWGIHGKLAKTLYEIGVNFIDVAGTGGTSWSQVERYRTTPLLAKTARAFAGWGIPTTDCLVDVRQQSPTGYLIASGGLKTGVDAAKSLALGADLAGFGRSVLHEAAQSDPSDLLERLEQIELELRIAMFGAGVATVDELANQHVLSTVVD